MQSSGLSGPQVLLSLKLHELCTANKVSKKHLGELGKLVGVLGGVRNNSYELRNAIKSMGKSTEDLMVLFSLLNGVLDRQNSRMFDKKQRQLKSIEKIIMPVAKEIDSKAKRLKIDNIDREIRVTKKEIGKLDDESRKNGEKILRLEQDIRWAKTSDSDLESIRNKRRERANELNAEALERWENRNSWKDRDIQSRTNSKDRAVEHASNHGVAVRVPLDLAIAGKIYDPENTGFGPMWSSHIQSDEFVMKKFGCIEGYGKYEERIKVPNAEGEMWKILVKDFMGSPARLDKLQSEKTKLENGYRQQAELMTRQAKIPHEKISEQEITEKYNAISTFKEENENREQKITDFKVSISELERERTKLLEDIMVLQRLSPVS